MKKLLIWIFAFFIGCISFTSAGAYISDSDYCVLLTWYTNWESPFNIEVDSAGIFMGWVYNPTNWDIQSSAFEVYTFSHTYPLWSWSSDDIYMIYLMPLSWVCPSGWGSGSSLDITVYYNNWLTTNIACNWDNIITIDWLSTMSSISTFTPYFNINYIDQNNQVLTDSYSNSILYLSGGQYLKTYTWWSNNDWILNLVTSEDTVFTWYLPTFDVTWNITEIDTWNVFNNFAENSLTVLLSNIPNYIQYVIMFALLLFVLWIFRRLRK